MAKSMTKSIIFGSGCFWCTEAVFKRLDGVVNVTPGYAGGTKQNPTYAEVCSGSTGHAEVVQIEYDSKSVSLKDLLGLFFRSHDPTTEDRQGNDIGSQYRSIIICKASEAALVKKLMAGFQKGFVRPITTEVQTDMEFYPAEISHKDYYARNPLQPYCMFVIRPKLAKLGL